MARARETFAASFESAEAKSEHYRELAARSVAARRERVTISRDEAAGLVQLGRVLVDVLTSALERQSTGAHDPENDNAPADVTGAGSGV